MALTLALAAGECSAGDPFAGCAKDDQLCMFEVMARHPALQSATWRDVLGRPVEERIGPAPATLVEYLTLDNRKNGFPERPRATTANAAFLADVRAAFAELPATVRRRAGEKLVGIFLVDELGGTGFSERLFDSPAPRGFIVLDAAVLGARTANAWATWKESSPFKPAPGYSLSARIAPADGDTRRGAIQYILLHELGHVLSIGGDVHPRWDLPANDVGSTARYAFYNLSWSVDTKANEHRAYTDGGPLLPRRREIAYYFGARLEAADMLPVYRDLQQTNFPTLYAATRFGDDFAEAFANYVHVVLLGRPFAIEITAAGGGLTYGACWEEARCAEKRRLLKKLLAE